MKKNLSQKSSLYIHAHVSIESMEYTIYKSVLYCVFFLLLINSLMQDVFLNMNFQIFNIFARAKIEFFFQTSLHPSYIT